jgi:hypothetical protein
LNVLVEELFVPEALYDDVIVGQGKLGAREVNASQR